MLVFDLFELLQAQFALVLKHQTLDKLKKNLINLRYKQLFLPNNLCKEERNNKNKQ